MIIPIPKQNKKKIKDISPKQKVIAVDFDGVIHDYKNPVKGRRMGSPIAGTKNALLDLKKKSYQIVIFCVWGYGNGKIVIADFMKYYELPYDQITNIKPRAEAYIDDKGIRFISWEEVLRLV